MVRYVGLTGIISYLSRLAVQAAALGLRTAGHGAEFPVQEIS